MADDDDDFEGDLTTELLKGLENPPAPDASADTEPTADPTEAAADPAEPAVDPAVPTPVAAPAPPVPVAAVNARERFKELTGYDAPSKYKTDDDFYRSVGELNRTLGERSEDAELGRWLRANPKTALERLQQEYGQPPQPVAPPAPAAEGPPEFDPAWEYQLFRTDPQTGQRQLVESPDPDVLAKYKRASEYAIARQRELILDPEKALRPVLEKFQQTAVEKAIEQIRKEAGERDAVRQREQLTQHTWGLLESSKELLFEGGDMQAAQPTQLGQWYMHFLDQAKGWQTSPDERHSYALGMARLKVVGEQPTAPAASSPGTPKLTPPARKPNTPLPPTGGTSDDWPEGQTLEQALGGLAERGLLLSNGRR